MKLIIAGSRTIIDYQVMHDADVYFGLRNQLISEVVSGCAAGPDTMGEQWAVEQDIPVKRMPPQWYVDGVKDPQAGYRRNRSMAKYVGLDGCLLALWDGQSAGTAHMIRMGNAMLRGVMIYRVQPRELIRMPTKTTRGILKESRYP